MNYFKIKPLKRINHYKLATASVVLSMTFFPLKTISAKPVTYNFTVNVVAGSLKGKTFKGIFSYDDEKLFNNKNETLTVADGLKVCMNFFDKIRTEKDDVNYSQFPQLIFEDGKPKILDFWVESSPRQIWWNNNGWQVNIAQNQDNSAIINCQF